MVAPLPAGFTETGAWTLLQVLAKATLVLAAAGLAAAPLRRAAARHLVWSLALGALLLLPPLALALPAWRLPWLRVSTRPADGLPEQALLEPGPAAAAPASLAAALLAVWALGVAAVLGRMLLGWWGVRRLAQDARTVRGRAARAELAALCHAAGVHAPVRLLRSETAAMPATWGVLRPTILLPAEADGWTLERRRVVLLHELAHVARRDWLTQTLATLCCAAYWFHPGAWWAARRMRIEREEACDDRVLAAGARPTDYAGHLLEVARAFRRASGRSAALAMARPSQLEARVRAVLDAGRDRGGVAFGAGGILALGVAVALLPLASATPTERPLAPPTQRVALPISVAAAPPVTVEAPAPRPAAASPRPEVPRALPVVPPVRPAVTAPARSAALPVAVDEPDERVAVDPRVMRARSLAELIRATASPQATVRRDAVRALAGIRDEAVVTPLARSLRDQDRGVRTMAARALGELAVVRPRPGPSAPVDAPIPAEPQAEAAAYALANRAAEALRVSLLDSDPDIRDTALRALEEVGEGIESSGGGSIVPPPTQNGISTIVSPGY